MVYKKSKTIDTAGSGWIKVQGEGSESSADVYVNTYSDGVSLTKSEAFDLIVLLCEGAGLQMDRTAADGLIIQKPENPAVAKRRDELAKEFDQTRFDNCYTGLKNAINYIVDGELEAGVLK